MAIKEDRRESAYSGLGANAPAAPETPQESKYKRTTFGIGLLKGLGITFRHLVSKSVTVEYPEEVDSPSPRSRGVIALKIENCTVCMLCARECPDWCIYIEGHKEARAPKEEGKRAKKFNVLDRFAIDYALCMYCGICVEVCPYDALFWTPEFEYADSDVVELTHEMGRLAEWMYTVQPPAELDEGAQGPELKAAPAPPETAVRGPAEQAKDIGGPVPTVSDPGAMEGQAPSVTAPVAPTLDEPSGSPTSQQAPAAQAPARPTEPPKPKFDPDQVRQAVLKAELKAGTDEKVAQKRADTAAARVVEEAYAGMPAATETTEAALKAEGAPAAIPTAEAEAPAPGQADAAAQPAQQEGAPASEAPAAGATPEEAAAIRAQVLEEERRKGGDPRVAEARAKAAEMRALKGTKGPK